MPQQFCAAGLVPSAVFRGGALRELLDHKAPTQPMVNPLRHIDNWTVGRWWKPWKVEPACSQSYPLSLYPQSQLGDSLLYNAFPTCCSAPGNGSGSFTTTSQQ